MRKNVYYQTLTTIFLFATFLASAQKKYDTKTTKSTLSLEGKSLSGFTTDFDFDRESVRRGWWEYAREFGSPLNMKEYYKVTIPSSTTDGNVDLVIYTQTMAGDGGISFFLGVETDNYADQAESLLLDFKKDFYIDDLLEKIDRQEKKAGDLSDEYEDSVIETRKAELLDQLSLVKKEIERLKEEIRKIERK